MKPDAIYMLSVVYTTWHVCYCYAECCYAECRNAECCHAECRYAEYRGAHSDGNEALI